jgi:hypothetical protein
MPRCRYCLHGPPPVKRFILGIALFQCRIAYGHTLCISAIMPKALHPSDTGVELTPKFASAAEIELAEKLRRQLEDRYLEASAAPPSLQNRSGETH